MNLRQIEAFKAVMETGTVTMAAARLHISQPAVSKLLQLFERGARMKLFVRDRGRLSPTPEARLLYDEVERVFQGAGRIRQAAEEIRSLERGSLAVGAMPALSVGFVQEMLARLGTEHPGVVVQVHSRDTPKLVEQLVTHQIELVLSVLPMDHPEIRTESLCRVPLVCILPPGHRLSGRREIRCRDLAGERFASFRHDSAVRRRIDQAFEDAKVIQRIVLEAPMAPTICAFVARGLGVSIVNPLYVGAFAPALVVRPFRPRIESEISMAMPRGRRLS
ncbi:MAG TPA: LysR substrate-binding domain-containing protein, partial [Usitatibacteraceae bacterium]|nr:LysR substrate-binding domain-containing protein [Usitatibacteraceae bacterium]